MEKRSLAGRAAAIALSALLAAGGVSASALAPTA